MPIVIVRLNNGMDVAGEIVKDEPGGIVLRRPLLVNYKYMLGGYPSVSFTKYIVFTDVDEIPFKRDALLHVVEAKQTFAKFYEYALEKYYYKLSMAVDEELNSFLNSGTIGDAQDIDTVYEQLLESVSVEGMTKN